MDIVRKGREGTDFTIQIVITHLSALLITIASGKLADLVGFKTLFLAESILAIAVLLSIKFLYRENLTDKINEGSVSLTEEALIKVDELHETGS